MSALPGFGAPVLGDKWLLMNYTGALTDNAMTFGAMPPLLGGLSYAIDTGTAGQVNLAVVPEPASAGLLLAAAGLLALRRRRASR